MFRKYLNILYLLILLTALLPFVCSARSIEDFAADAVTIEGYRFISAVCSSVGHFTINCVVETDKGPVNVMCQKTMTEGNVPYSCSVIKY